MNPVYAALGDTIFDVMSGLARETGAVNLGQGFPEWDGPLDIRERAARAIIDGPNQYPPMRGLPILREAIAEHYKRLQGIDLDWQSEITVTSGATEALAAALLSVLQPGDEVVLFEPMYDSYLPMLRRAGAAARFVRLSPPHWRIDPEQLATAFTAKTRAVVLNTPLNPTASLFGAEDLHLIAEQCIKHDCIAISDEVWEHCVFDGASHLSMLNVPGMRERTIKIGSAGKMFSMTGWKVGFACAAPALTTMFARAHQFLTFTTPPNLQQAVAYGLSKPRQHFDDMRGQLTHGRDRIAAALKQEGFHVLPSAGTYFMGVDLNASGIDMTDADFAVRAVRECGVATIPFSAFYTSAPASSVVRLCFAKSDATIDKGVEGLAKARKLFA
ncbi:MAG TPA: aminotransferase [Hyphomonadaceae bacterium]|nr:aminotransferase [Hyphomonadaceae bacterium]HPN04347.1 aminotransferase [Hyphomonadaceae bacterium]